MQRAIDEGADFIEADILSSKDGVLICSHDVVLDYITDIADHVEFANRKTTYEVQGFKITGWFTGINSISTCFPCLNIQSSFSFSVFNPFRRVAKEASSVYSANRPFDF